ncbi:hypothetical protein M885DRAFT_495364 [Pelagophyceae sp. CCMP2097]|nr:hypothetical protein M885DRAFT_495364 [Pelagophyceae sp. CCMP2097]
MFAVVAAALLLSVAAAPAAGAPFAGAQMPTQSMDANSVRSAGQPAPPFATAMGAPDARCSSNAAARPPRPTRPRECTRRPRGNRAVPRAGAARGCADGGARTGTWLDVASRASAAIVSRAALFSRAAPAAKALMTSLLLASSTYASKFTDAPRHRAVVVVSGATAFDRHPEVVHSKHHIVQLPLIEKFVVDALDSDSDTEVIGVVFCLNAFGFDDFRNATRKGLVKFTDEDNRVFVSSEDSHDQWERLDKCFKHAREAQEKRGWGAATHFLRVRPDTIFTKRILPLSLLKADFVSGRARSLSYAEPTRTSRGQLSAFWVGCSPTNPMPSSKAMAKAHLGFCATFDDIFAVIPAKLAPAYFLLEPNYPDEAEPGALVWSDSPFFLNPDAAYLAAIRETYGSNNDSHAFRSVCRSVTKANDPNAWCCEPRLTMRLAMRLVPYAIEPYSLTVRRPVMASLDEADVTC